MKNAFRRLFGSTLEALYPHREATNEEKLAVLLELLDARFAADDDRDASLARARDARVLLVPNAPIESRKIEPGQLHYVPPYATGSFPPLDPPSPLEEAVAAKTRELLFATPPEGLPLVELTGPGVSQAHFTCERCNGSGVTGPELGTCGECNGAGGKVIDMAAEVAVEPPPLTPEQLAAHVCESCGHKGHRFFDCPREVHF